MIWIFPKTNRNLPVNSAVFVGFAYPTLLALPLDIAANADPAYPGDPCYKILTPTCGSSLPPNCTYAWSLNGNIFSTLLNPAINTNTQYGNFSLEVTVPTSTNTNTFGTNCTTIASSVLALPRCNVCINLPRIQ